MKQNPYFLNTALAALLGLVLLACSAIRAFVPAFIFPQADVPNLMLVSLAALLVDHYAARGAKRCYLCIPVLSAVSFGLLPYAAGFVTGLGALKLALMGAVVFTAATWLFSSVQDRLSSGPVAKAAPALSALGLYLASQCLAGMFV